MKLRREIVAIPVKQFTRAKSRLRESMTALRIEELSRSLVCGVIEACSPRPCVVLFDSDDVRQFALDRGALTLRVSDHGLNEAIRDAYRALASSYDLVIFAHGDLVAPTDLGSFEFADGATIVTDRHETGTNVLALPTNLPFQFHYGPGSALRHRLEVEKLGLPLRWISNSPWGLDIDGPEDLELLQR